MVVAAAVAVAVAVWSGGCLDGAGRDAVAVLWVGARLRRIAEARRCCILAHLPCLPF
jgi:hypothetical protein